MLSDKSLQMIFVYAAYGKSMMSAHKLELKLLAIVSCYPERLPEKCTAESVGKMTFGALVNLFVKCFNPPEELIEELDNMIYFRNELAHRISNLIILRAKSYEWHEAVIKELGEIDSYFKETREMLSPYIKECHKKLNVTEEKINKIAFVINPYLQKIS